MKNTLIVNFFGGPCVGKSTVSSDVYVRLKRLGMNVEAVTEFSAECCWEQNLEVLNHQVIVLGEQYRRMVKLIGKVDVVVTDSPLLLSAVYDRERNPHLKQFIIDKHNELRSLNFFIKRSGDDYSTYGRKHDYYQAIQKDDEIHDLLIQSGIEFYLMEQSEKFVGIVVDIIKRTLEEKPADPQNSLFLVKGFSGKNS